MTASGKATSTATAPPTTTTTSPRTPGAAHSASSASVPRATSSCSFVSSRQTAARSVGAERRGHVGEGCRDPGGRLEEDHRARLAGEGARGRRGARPDLRGRNPSNVKRSVGSPETASAVSTALGPGIDRDGDPRLRRGGDEPVARVADRRHAGIRQHQQVLVARELDELGGALLLVVVVQGDAAAGDSRCPAPRAGAASCACPRRRRRARSRALRRGGARRPRDCRWASPPG